MNKIAIESWDRLEDRKLVYARVADITQLTGAAYGGMSA